MPHTDPTLWQSLGQAIAGRATDFSSYDGPAVLAAARDHGVCPLLAEVRYRGTAKGLTTTIEDSIRQYAHHHVALDLTLTAETRHCLDLLKNAKVPVLLLKGTALAHLHYPQPWLRPRCDADLYIPRESIDSAAECLADAGYRVQGREADRHSVKQFHARRRIVQDASLTLDLHFRISNRALFRDCLPFGEAESAAQPVPALHGAARALADGDLLLHACLHRIAHGRNSERDRLVWLYDIHLLVEAIGDGAIGQFRERALRQELGAVCGDALATCRSLFGTTVSKDMLERLNSRADREPSARMVNAGRLEWVLSDLAGERGLSNKFGLARELLANRLR